MTEEQPVRASFINQLIMMMQLTKFISISRLQRHGLWCFEHEPPGYLRLLIGNQHPFEAKIEYFDYHLTPRIVNSEFGLFYAIITSPCRCQQMRTSSLSK
jgi:hypothetical protein